MSERTQLWARLYTEEGLTYQEIADRYGVTRQRVGQVLGPMGIVGERMQRRAAQHERDLITAHERIRSGESTTSQEAERLGYADASSLRGLLHKRGMLIGRREPQIAEHGTLRRYRQGCTCDECRGANTERHRKLREKGGQPPRHGESGYRNYGCKCKICKEAVRVAARNRRAQNRRLKEART